MTRTEGASDRMVTSATSWSARSVTPPPAPRSSDSVCALAPEASMIAAADAMIRRAAKNRAEPEEGPRKDGARFGFGIGTGPCGPAKARASRACRAQAGVLAQSLVGDLA